MEGKEEEKGEGLGECGSQDHSGIADGRAGAALLVGTRGSLRTWTGSVTR